jgi:DNA-binding FadR family transcriptional regulator
MARSTDKRQGAGRISDRIAASIRRQIAEGRLSAGTRLPAEREMARRHKVSRVTIREAYRSLEQLGMISIRRGASGGATIMGRQAPAMPHGARNQPLLDLLRALTDLTLQVLAANEQGTPVRLAPPRLARSSRSSAA